MKRFSESEIRLLNGSAQTSYKSEYLGAMQGGDLIICSFKGRDLVDRFYVDVVYDNEGNGMFRRVRRYAVPLDIEELVDLTLKPICPSNRPAGLVKVQGAVTKSNIKDILSTVTSRELNLSIAKCLEFKESYN